MQKKRDHSAASRKSWATRKRMKLARVQQRPKASRAARDRTELLPCPDYGARK
jgi:hypothetical protein